MSNYSDMSPDGSHRKVAMDMIIVSNVRISDRYSLLKVSPLNGASLPEILPGQFVQIAVDTCKTTFLRRPISVHYVDYADNSLNLLIARAGAGTNTLCDMREGLKLNILLPLGNTFCIDRQMVDGKRLLLIGGGVGVAPLLYYGAWLKEYTDADVEFLLAARSASDLLLCSEFERIAPTHYVTDDGSRGEKGYAVSSSVLAGGYDRWAVCGPAPMMRTLVARARELGVSCEVSLENMMACGLGACLCCVEKTVRGNVCVCTEGPVFDIDMLTW